MAMQSQQQIRIPRSDSPSDVSNPSILQHIHSQDQLYNMHPNSNGIYPNGNPTNQIHDYPTDLDIQKQQQSAKLNGAFPRAPFNSFPNTTRPRQLSSFRESTSSAFFPSQPSNDIFNPQLTSPTQPHMPPFLDSRQGYDFPNNLPKQPNYNNISAEPFNPSHKPPGQQHNSVFSPHGSQYGNGVSVSSQTPFGPHNIVTGGMNGNVVPPQGLVNGSNQNSMHEDISTIFVVGFPDDMQEREFQNMFTFSAGFEAATLKIPNKEYNAYGGVNGQNRPFANDPYSLEAREQPLGWPDEAGAGIPPGSHLNNMGVPPRKQIIGFAKFRSKEEALIAKDMLQGKRVDIEKGAVLKAEMAKKNLHTKRGVGPILPLGVVPNGINGAGLNSVVGPAVGSGAPLVSGVQNPSGMIPQQMIAGSGGHTQQDSIYSLPPDAISPRDTSTQQQLGAIGAPVGLNPNRMNSVGPWPEPTGSSQVSGVTRELDDRRRDSVLGAIGVNNRGSRERAEEEERDRRRRDKDLRIRSTPMNAFDAFHSVAQPITRQAAGNPNGSGMMSPSIDGPSTKVNGIFPNGFGPQQHSGVAQQQPNYFSHAGAVEDPTANMPGPWDNVGKVAPVRQATSSSRHSPTPSASEPKRSFSPSAENKGHRTESSQSSQSESRASSADGHPRPPAAAADIASAMNDLALSTSKGNTSPQLPSPASGASSGSNRNGVDQNPPINTLYVGNLPTSPSPLGMPADILEDSLRELFQSRPGFRRLSFKQKSSGPMCFVEFEDVNHATKALNDLYGHTLNGLVKGGGIRLSYSKNPLGVRTPTSANSSGPTLQQQQSLHHSSFMNDERRRGGGGGGSAGGVGSLTSPPPSATGFLPVNTQPPRFFSSSPSGSSFAPNPNPPMSNADAFVPRSNNAGLYGYNLAPIATSPSMNTSFSPFGIPPAQPSHSMIPDQKDSDHFNNNNHHSMPRALSPPTTT